MRIQPALKKLLFFCACLVPGGAGLPAMDWPSPAGIMNGSFGGNSEGRPLLGDSFEAEGPINAADRGELLYRRGEEDPASRLPSPLGAWAALDHGDGIISIYSRMDDKNLPRLPDMAEKSTVVGEAGVSGWSGTKGFYFSLFDRKERRWINPSMIITPLPDTRPPEIRSVRLKDAEDREIDLARTRTISQGRYFIFVECVDTLTSAAESPLAPYRIVCLVNGAETGALNFETYSARDGALMVYRNGLIPVKEVFASYPAYEVSEARFTRGQATLELIAQDIAGNSRSVVFRLQVE